MTWISGPRATIDQYRRAIARHLGLPKAPDHIGANCRGRVPAEYTPGAKGWTDSPCRVADNATRSQSAIEVPDDLAAELQGQTIDVRGTPVQFDFRGGTARPPVSFLRESGDDDTLRGRSAGESRTADSGFVPPMMPGRIPNVSSKAPV